MILHPETNRKVSACVVML